jgi:probable F420-dependent oxidoreductase
VEFGFTVRTSRPGANPDEIVRQVKHGEELGFSLVGIPDHVVIPTRIDSPYPYSADGSFAGAAGECLEQLSVASFLAAHTSKIRILTSVMVVPHRPAVLAAKTLATIDVLSKGRLTVGLGAGWMKEEFEALGAPPFEHRGSVVAEFVAAFRELWTADNPSVSGKYVNVADVKFLPKPVQKPHPPIWMGGESPAALRRAGRLADAWYPIGNNPSYPMDTIERLRAGIAAIRHHAKEAGRRPDSVSFAYNTGWYDDERPQASHDGSRRIFTGTPEQVAGDIEAFRSLGVRHLVIGFAGPSVGESMVRMDRFAAKVRPLVRDGA